MALAGRLRDAGVDVDAARAAGLIAMRRADSSLASFMVDDEPDADLFRATVVPLLQAALAGGAQRVRVYGEMVDLLCRAGQPAAALRLVSRDLARVLGGDIALDSEAGRGSRFTVRVPARPPVAAV